MDPVSAHATNWEQDEHSVVQQQAGRADVFLFVAGEVHDKDDNDDDSDGHRYNSDCGSENIAGDGYDHSTDEKNYAILKVQLSTFFIIMFIVNEDWGLLLVN